MADAKSLFDQGEDVDPKTVAAAKSLFDSAEDHAPVEANRYAPEDQKDVSSLEAAGLNWGGPVTGIKQGATLGFGDEIAALAGAAGAKYGGDERGFWDVYRDVLDSTRREQKQVNDEHGVATTVGELAGGFVSPLGLVGGAVGGAGGAAAGSAAAKAGFLAKAANMAKVGAIGGGAIGLGNSEADLTSGDTDQLIQGAKDTVEGAGMGAALGAGMQAAGSAISATGRGIGAIAKKLPVTDDIMTVFNKTRAGQELLGKAQQFSKENRDLARTIFEDMSKLQKQSTDLMNKSTDELNATKVKVDVKKVVEDLRAKLASLKATHPDEKADIKAFQDTLASMIDEQEQVVTSFIKKPTNPNLIDAETKAERTVAQKTAEAEVKDGIRAEQIERAIENEAAQNEPDEGEIKRLTRLLKRVRGENSTSFPPETIADDVTGINVKAVDRGMGKSPIASAVMDPPESIYTPLQKVQRTQVVAQSPTATPEEVNKLIRSARQGVSSSKTDVGGEAFGMAKDSLNNELKTALSTATPAPGNPTVAESLAAYNKGSGDFSNTVTAKEMLGLPKKYGVFENGKEVNDTNRLQNLIRDYHQGTQKSQVVNEALNELGQSFPDKAAAIKAKVAEGSKNEYLANELSRGSEFARDPRKILASGKAALLQGARVAGKVAQTGDNAAKAITNLGTNVYNSSPQALQSMAAAAQAGGKSFAGALSKVVNAPMARRKALLFTLMQQQEFRDFAHQHMPVIGEDSDK